MGWKIKSVIALCVLSFALFGCATKNKTVRVKEQNREVSHSAETSASSSGSLNIKSGFESFGISQFAQAASFMNWQFSGASPEDEFSLEINQTETGYEMKASGVGTANAGQNREESQSKWQNEWQSKYDSLAKVNSHEISELNQRISAFEKDKKVDKLTAGFQTGIYLIGAFALVVFIILFWLGWKFRKLGKSVQAFLNFKNLLK